ncbi:MAG: phosphohydrolase [Deltaproteobacteria bacterium]|nr:MAG: phosphohydrolase [Deltaproteobacteria bacterium]
MSWIQTYTGKQFWPLEPERNTIDIEDIAHSLSMLCRFNGHCLAFYSVAEHCVRVSRILPPESAKWGLLHDAGEAYLVDMPKPLKRMIPEFEEHENHLLESIAQHFGLSWPIPKDVHHADVVMLMTEKRDLMSPEPESWGIDVEPLSDTIHPMSPMEAKAAFLERFQELMGPTR